jgi:hypothetical protein
LDPKVDGCTTRGEKEKRKMKDEEKILLEVHNICENPNV